MSFTNCPDLGDRAADGFIVVRHVGGKGGSVGYLVDGGRVYRSVEEARRRAMELCGTKKYDFSGEYRAVRA